MKVNYYVQFNVSEKFKKEPLREQARTLLANKSFCGGGALEVEEIKCEQVGQIEGTFESTGRVYSSNGLSPTINTCGGGKESLKLWKNR